MRRISKKHLLLALLLVLILTIIGCGSNDVNDSASSSPANSELPSASPTTDGETKISGKLEIQYFVGGYGDTWWKEIIAEFQENHPELEVIGLGGPKINDQTKPRWIEGNPPDVVYIDGDGTFTEAVLVGNDQLMDLTDWFQTANNIDNEAISNQLIVQPRTYEDAIYSVPLVVGVHGTWYDKAFLESNGWAIPTNYAEFLDISQKALDKGIAPYIHQGQFPSYIFRGLMRQGFVTANGGDPSINDDINNMVEGVYKSEPVMKTLDKLVEMNEKGYLSKSSLALNHTDAQNQWLMHKAVFLPSGLWLENEMREFAPKEFDYGFIPSVTQDTSGDYVAVPYVNEIGIAKNAKNPDAAKAFLEFVFTKQHSIQWAEATGVLMNVKVDLESSNASNAAKSAIAYLNSADMIVTSTDSTFNPNVKKVVNDATTALLSGDITPAEWGERVEKEAANNR